MKKFKLGDKVKWWSSFKDKQGEIVLVIPIMEPPYRMDLEKHFPGCTAAAIDGGSRRDHESYIVRVPSGTKAKDKMYWPRVSKLELVHPF